MVHINLKMTKFVILTTVCRMKTFALNLVNYSNLLKCCDLSLQRPRHATFHTKDYLDICNVLNDVNDHCSL